MASRCAGVRAPSRARPAAASRSAGLAGRKAADSGVARRGAGVLGAGRVGGELGVRPRRCATSRHGPRRSEASARVCAQHAPGRPWPRAATPGWSPHRVDPQLQQVQRLRRDEPGASCPARSRTRRAGRAPRHHGAGGPALGRHERMHERPSPPGAVCTAVRPGDAASANWPARSGRGARRPRHRRRSRRPRLPARAPATARRRRLSRAIRGARLTALRVGNLPFVEHSRSGPRRMAPRPAARQAKNNRDKT